MLTFDGSFLEGPKAALLASKYFEDGHYHEPPQHGIWAFARVYCAWAYGQTVRSLYFKLLRQISWICYHTSGFENINTDGMACEYLII